MNEKLFQKNIHRLIAILEAQKIPSNKKRSINMLSIITSITF